MGLNIYNTYSFSKSESKISLTFPFFRRVPAEVRNPHFYQNTLKLCISEKVYLLSVYMFTLVFD